MLSWDQWNSILSYGPLAMVALWWTAYSEAWRSFLCVIVLGMGIAFVVAFEWRWFLNWLALEASRF